MTKIWVGSRATGVAASIAEVDAGAFAQARQSLRHADRVATAIERHQPLLDGLCDRLRSEKLDALAQGNCLRADELDRELDELHRVFNAAAQGGRL